MENTEKRKKPAKKIIITAATISVLIAAFLVFTCVNIYKNLKEFGYGMKELPRTVAVYLHLSKGFTVGENEYGETIFIGRHSYIYKTAFALRGYHEADRYGMEGWYNKTGNEDDPIDFEIISTNEWCHWFRIYLFDGGKIEDYL